MKWPKPIGNSRILTLPRFNKTMFIQKFQHPRSKKEYEFVSFGFKNPIPTIIIFPLTKNFEVVAIRQYRHGSHKAIIELPGGQKTAKENNKKTGQRELLEETGYASKNMIQLNRNPLIIDPDNFVIFYHALYATECYKIGDPNLEKTEYTETVLIPFPKWKKMILEGKIIESKSIVVTHLVELYFS